MPELPRRGAVPRRNSTGVSRSGSGDRGTNSRKWSSRTHCSATRFINNTSDLSLSDRRRTGRDVGKGPQLINSTPGLQRSSWDVMARCGTSTPGCDRLRRAICREAAQRLRRSHVKRWRENASTEGVCGQAEASAKVANLRDRYHAGCIQFRGLPLTGGPFLFQATKSVSVRFIERYECALQLAA